MLRVSQWESGDTGGYFQKNTVGFPEGDTEGVPRGEFRAGLLSRSLSEICCKTFAP